MTCLKDLIAEWQIAWEICRRRKANRIKPKKPSVVDAARMQ